MTARPPYVLLDDARPDRARLSRFARPSRTIAAHTAAEVPAALAALEAARGQGHHLAGYFAYELGLVLEPKLAPLLPPNRQGPLLWFGVFEAPEILEGAAAEAALAAAPGARAYAGPLEPEWNEEAYSRRFARTHDWIEAGDIYQANLSFRAGFAFAGDPMTLYRDLRARAAAAHCAFIDDGQRHILSLSPELFFDISAEGRLTAKPMKGTAARGADAQADEAARDWLAASAKDRAENLMIVDLLRNDLGRIAEIGSVAVRDLFAVETYPTLHTMVSTVTAQLKPGADIAAILKGLFPCGSVTGAPKIRAMEIIEALEESPRGVYCGAIGHFAPDGIGQFQRRHPHAHHCQRPRRTRHWRRGGLRFHGAFRICRVPAQGALLHQGSPPTRTDRNAALCAGRGLCAARTASGADGGVGAGVWPCLRSPHGHRRARWCHGRCARAAAHPPDPERSRRAQGDLRAARRPPRRKNGVT